MIRKVALSVLVLTFLAINCAAEPAPAPDEARQLVARQLREAEMFMGLVTQILGEVVSDVIDLRGKPEPMCEDFVPLLMKLYLVKRLAFKATEKSGSCAPLSQLCRD